MTETIYDKKAAIRNSIVYGVLFALALWVLFTRTSATGYVLTGLAVLWTIGGLMANVRAIKRGFRIDE